MAIADAAFADRAPKRTVRLESSRVKAVALASPGAFYRQTTSENPSQRRVTQGVRAILLVPVAFRALVTGPLPGETIRG